MNSLNYLHNVNSEWGSLCLAQICIMKVPTEEKLH